MSEVDELMLFGQMMESLHSAFLARQSGERRDYDCWGERFFNALEDDHREWLPEITAVYAMAQDLLYGFGARQVGLEAARCLFQRPRNLLGTVLMLLGQPGSSYN